MNRLLRTVCLCSLCPLLLLGCGDDGSGGDDVEDGGAHFVDQNDFNDAIGDLSGDVDDINGALGHLDTDVADLNERLTAANDALEGIGGRVDSLENPDIGSCSAEELCIPDGVDLVRMNMGDLVAALCEREIGCCSEDELNLKFGPGITTVDQCVETFVDLINNGLSPSFLQDSSLVISHVIDIVRLLNDPAVRVEVDQEGVATCVEFLGARDCDVGAGGGHGEGARCVTAEAGSEDPCSLDALTNGLQEAGELCDTTSGVDQCESGLTCRTAGGEEGICGEIAEAGDRCVSDAECDGERQEMFCNRTTGRCQARGDVGDDCAYIDGTFAFHSPVLDPRWDNASAWAPTAYAAFREWQSTSIDCRTGTVCSPETFTCVRNCGQSAICSDNADCPEGLTCNFGLNQNLQATFGLGSCQQTLVVGDGCMADAECATGRCSLDGDVYACHASNPAGAACDTRGPDDTCESRFCGFDGTCSTRCDSDAECPDTHFCDEDTVIDESAPLHPCERRRSIPNGTDCADEVDGTHESEWVHLQCASGRCLEGVCEAKSGEGDACIALSDCPTTHYCKLDELAMPPASSCEPVIALGEDCSGDDGECGPGNYCDDATGDCTAFAQQGEDCSSTLCDAWAYDEELDAELECYTYPSGDQTCEYFGSLPSGAHCEGGCSSGRCNEVDGEWICRERLAEGENCDLDEAVDERDNGGCEDALFCKTPDAQRGEGECAAKGSAGQPCAPWREGDDCRGSGACELRNDGFFCNEHSSSEDAPLFCGSEVVAIE